MRTFKPPVDYGKDRPQRTLMRLKRWAEIHQVELAKIPEELERKTPDQKAIFPDADRTEIIVEVKEITISAHAPASGRSPRATHALFRRPT